MSFYDKGGIQSSDPRTRAVALLEEAKTGFGPNADPVRNADWVGRWLKNGHWEGLTATGPKGNDVGMISAKTGIVAMIEFKRGEVKIEVFGYPVARNDTPRRVRFFKRLGAKGAVMKACQMLRQVEFEYFGPDGSRRK